MERQRAEIEEGQVGQRNVLCRHLEEQFIFILSHNIESVPRDSEISVAEKVLHERHCLSQIDRHWNHRVLSTDRI